MRNFKTVMGIALVTLLMIACSNSNTPTAAIEKAFDHAKKGNFVEYVECLEGSENAKPEEKEGFAELMKKVTEGQGGIKSYEVLEEKIAEDGLNATVKVKITYGNGDSDTKETSLKKVDGKWKIEL